MEDAVKFIKGALNATAPKADQDEATRQLTQVMKQICNNS